MCFETRAKRSDEVVRQEPRFVESSMFGQWDRLAGAFRLKRTDRCPLQILWVYDPRGSVRIVTVDTRSPLKVGGPSSWNSQNIFSKLSARMMSSYCTGASSRTNPVHHQFSC